MKEVIFIAIVTIAPLSLFAQCTKVIQASDGYNVTIQLNPVSLVMPSSCQGGYTYNVNINYDVQFSGINVPGNLWTLQGEITCGPNAGIFFNLPNNGGSGMTTTSGNPWRSFSDCTTATPQSIGCNAFEIEINGPGIPNQTVSCSFALPVELLSFQYQHKDKGVELSWETATETQNDFFTIERSYDGLVWEAIHKVEGAKYSTSLQNYSFLDYPKTNKTVIYYRLKQTDLDGTENLSHILAVKLNDSARNSLLTFPNPTTNQIQISGDSDFENWALMNAQGVNVSQKIRVNSYEKGSLQLNLSELAKGYYYFQSDGQYQTIVKL
jgi:hypothetical protein